MPTTPQKPSLLADSVLTGLLKLFLPGLLVLLGGLLLYYSIAFERTMEGLKLQQREQVEQSKRTLLKDLKTTISDLVILSELEAIRELNGAETERALHHLTQHFTALAKHRKLYDQIRYLDSHGMEVVRVNFNQGNPQPVPQEQLQNKGQRYYFHDSFILKRQQIFISPLDLNIERGEIEEPYKPVIRLGMPLFNSAGEKVGVVLLNYLAQQLLDTLAELGNANHAEAMLLNADGYWLAHPDPRRRWGFMHNNGETMARYQPQEWAQIRHLESGQIESDAGIFTYDTLFPLGEEMLSSDGAATPYTESRKMLTSRAYFWKMVSHLSSRQIEALANQQLLFVALHGSLLMLVLLALSWWRAYSRYSNRLTQLALEEEHRRHASTLASAIDAIITTDAEGHIIEYNPSASKLFSFDLRPVVGQDIMELIIPEEYQEQHLNAMKLSNQKQHYVGKGRFEAVAQTIEGRRFPVEITIVRIMQQQLHTYTAFLRDISERKAHEESIRSAKRQLEMRVNQRTQELLKINQNLQEQIVERVHTEERLKIAQEELEASNRKLAEHAAKDSLTQIANRRAFDTRLNEEWRRCQRSGEPLALIMFDIDFFKRFNDNYGHLAGDECLRRIGELLQQGHYAQRASDLVARYGGEEFVVILSAATLSSAINIGEQIRHDIEKLQISHEFRGDDLQPVITVSLGAATLHPQHHNTPENLIAAADDALYRAKLLGRNRLISSEEALTLQTDP